MTISDVIALAGVIIAALGLLPSLYNKQRKTKLSKIEGELYEPSAQIELLREHDRITQSQKANLSAKLQKDGRNSYRLVIENLGQGTARNVKATLDDKPILEHPAIASNQQEVTLIGPHSKISYTAAITFGCSPPFKFRATWEDDSGEPGEYETTLTFL